MDNEHGLGKILTGLMLECDIDDATLSRQTGIPASTISRMRLNPNANPTTTTLRPIAKFFDVSISQLIGDESISKDRLPGTHFPISFTLNRIPILEWNWVMEWIGNNISDFKDKLNNWISTEKEISDKSFALVIPTDSFGIAFRKGSLIISDPNIKPKDGDLALLTLEEDKNILLRQILKDGNDIYLRSINPEIKGTHLISEKHEFLGTIVETRFSLQDQTRTVLEPKSAVKLNPACLDPVTA